MKVSRSWRRRSRGAFCPDSHLAFARRSRNPVYVNCSPSMAICRTMDITISMYKGVFSDVGSTAISFRILATSNWFSSRYRGSTLGRGLPGGRPGRLLYKRFIAQMFDGDTRIFTGMPEEHR